MKSFLFRNLTADLSSCAKESGARQTTILLIIRIRWAAEILMFARSILSSRFWVFWCRQWLLLIELKITVITSSFGLPAPPSPSPAPSTTAQPSSPVSRDHHLYLSEKKKLTKYFLLPLESIRLSPPGPRGELSRILYTS